MTKDRNSLENPNLTPMVDVIFQLLIFFMLTMRITHVKDDTVQPARAPNAPVSSAPAARPAAPGDS